MTDEYKDFRKRLWKAQQEMPVMQKEAQGFKFKYTDLVVIIEQIRPILEKHKLGFLHVTSFDKDTNSNVVTTEVFCEDTLESMASELMIPAGVKIAGMNEFQVMGSALTYFRRYHILIMLGILTEEDIDSLQPKKAVEKLAVDYVAKVNELIKMGRTSANLERYYSEYKSKMAQEESAQIIKIIQRMKNETK
jgi:hypothetical protein